MTTTHTTEAELSARLAAAEAEIERPRAALAAADARGDILAGDDDEEQIAAYEEFFGTRLLRTVVTARGAV